MDDKFVELGGHSLMAIQAVSRLRDTFGVEVTLRDVVENATISQLAEVIDLALSNDPETKSGVTSSTL